MASIAERQGVHKSTPEKRSGIEGNHAHVETVIADVAITTVRCEVVGKVGIGMKLELLQGLHVHAETETADLFEGVREVVAVGIFAINGRELKLSPTEESHCLNQHRVVVLIEGFSQFVGEALTPVASTGWGWQFLSYGLIAGQRCPSGSRQSQQGSR
jgi:hypothetical protein